MNEVNRHPVRLRSTATGGYRNQWPPLQQLGHWGCQVGVEIPAKKSIKKQLGRSYVERASKKNTDERQWA